MICLQSAGSVHAAAGKSAPKVPCGSIKVRVQVLQVQRTSKAAGEAAAGNQQHASYALLIFCGSPKDGKIKKRKVGPLRGPCNLFMQHLTSDLGSTQPTTFIQQ